MPPPSLGSGDVLPGRPVPKDPFAARKVQFDCTFFRTRAPDFSGRLQMLGLPAVAQREPDAAGAQPVSLQSNRIIEKFTHNAHVGTPPCYLPAAAKQRARRQCRRATVLAPDTARFSRSTERPSPR